MRKLWVVQVILVMALAWTSSASARQVPDSFADLVEKLTPAVVNVSTTQTVEVEGSPFAYLFKDMPEGGHGLGDLPELFQRFYGDNGEGGTPGEGEEGGNGGSMPTQKATSLGSGFVIDPDGYIVTNYHVIEKSEDITVTFSDDTKAEAKIVGKDSKMDLALLKVTVNHKLPFVEWGDSDKARVGDWVIAIGNPFGLGGSVSAGIISARARDINAGPFDDFLQTDAAINRGNSGGPLFDIEGKVIGINTAIFSPSGGNVGIGFAMPMAMAEPVIQQLKEHGRTYRGWLGVKIQTVTDEIAESLNMEKSQGALVLEVTPGSPAQEAGILPGDVIVKFDDQDIAAMRKLPRMVAETKVGKKVPVVLLRKGESKTLVVKIAELDEEKDKDSEATAPEKSKEKDELMTAAKNVLGMDVTTLTPELQKRFKAKEGTVGVLVVKVSPESKAAERGIQRGDVIQTANQEVVASPDDLIKLVEAAKTSGRKAVLLLISRKENTQFLALPLQ